ncbi:Imm9 family immunity protein, partial [Salmonella enterica]
FMDEKIRVLICTEVPRIDDNIDMRSIWMELNTYVKTLESNINLQDLGEWRILINVLAQRTDAIGVAKRVARFPSDKEYVIYISTPIPDNEQVSYGISNVKEAFFKENNEKYSYILESGFDSYDNLYNYMLETSKKTIHWILTRGISYNGIKIKLRS